MSGKRTYIDLDPDYEDVSEQQNKRRKFMEEDAKQATQRKIESIIKKHFDIEIESKESELLEISEKLEVARSIMDRLRACIVANFYGNATQPKTSSKKSSEQTPMIHPTVRKFIGKRPAGMSNVTTSHDVPVTSHSKQDLESEKLGHIVTHVPKPVQQQSTESGSTEKEIGESRQGRFKVKKRIIVGNLSKSIPADQRDDNDQATHKWMVYVRGPKESPNINGFVKKVWFFLHPSYRPNDLVEVSQPPFHLTRRGWGEFPVRIQIHFKDSRNKRVDIIHNLKLDRTYTGLQTLGAETIVDIEIERDIEERKTEKKNKSEKHNQSLHGSTLISHHNGDIKQEPVEQGYNDQEKTQIPCQTFPLLKEMKLEPIDHDYGKAACVSAFNSHTTTKKGLESQMGSGQNGSNITGYSPTLLTCIQTVGSPSVITTQAISVLTSISQAHNHLKVIPSGLAKQTGNPGNILLTSPPGNIVLKAVGSVTSPGNSPTVNLKVIDSGSVKSGTGSQATLNLTLTQPTVQTGLQPNKLQNITPNKIPVNKATNSGLIFLKCTDNQGKTFLIPQQINNTFTSPTKIVNSTGDLKTGPTNNRPVLLTGSLPTNTLNLSASGNVNVQGKQVVQTLIRSPGSASFTNRAQKSPSHNGPVFFIKPDNINRTPLALKTSNIASTHNVSTPMKVNSNLQIVRNCAQKQDAEVLCVKPVNQSLTPENQSTSKGQLKVTSQGLIHVQGQNISPGVGLVSNTAEKNLQNSVRPKQPIVLIPSNGKVALLPSKGKSLLNSVTNTQCMPGTGNNIILLNQSVSPLGGGNVVCVTPSALTNQTKPVSKGNQDMLVLQTKQSKSTASTPNHVVIIPVSSEQNSSIMSTNTVTPVVMTTQNKVTNDLSGRSAMDGKLNEKNMIFVVQKDKNTSGAATVLCNSSNVSSETTASLLTSQSLLNTNMAKSLSVSQQMTQVTVSSSDARPKQVILVNQNEDRTNIATKATEFKAEDRKCIMDPKKRKQKLSAVKEFIPPVCVSDYPDILSLIRAAVTRHPLVSDITGRSLHPYCAVTDEEWLSWNVGKRRASEWQRASSVRKFILQALGGTTTFKGESLWTTKQILVWCRLHAYSPHYLERPLHPTGIDIQAETSLLSDKHRQKFSSLTGVQEIHEELKITEHLTAASDIAEEEIDILSEVPVKSKSKVQDLPNENTDVPDPEFLPLTEGALYVEDMAQQIGVRLQQTEVEPGYFGTLTHGMLYKCMENFMSDIIRETFALQVNMGRYPDTLSVGDVYSALRNLSVSDFLTNKYLGVEDNMSVSTAPT